MTSHAILPLFTRAEMAALRDELAAYLDRLTRALTLPHAETEPDAPFDQRIERIAQRDPSYAHLLGAAIATDAHRSPLAHALAHDARLTQAAENLLGARIIDRTVRYRGNSSAMGEHRADWHSDVARDDGTDCASVKLTAWIPLSDAGPDTGGLELVAARRSAPLPHEKIDGHFVIPDHLVASDPKVQPLVPAGSALLMDRFTPHRALPNRSGKTRWSLVVWLKT